MKACTMEYLLRLELEHLHSSELQNLERLPRLMASLPHGPLKIVLEKFRWQTELQLARIEKVGELLGLHLAGNPCKATRTLYREADRLLRSGECLQHGLLVVFQRISQREIAGYGAARTYAHLLGLPQVAQLLCETLDEQSETFRHLRALAAPALQAA